MKKHILAILLTIETIILLGVFFLGIIYFNSNKNLTEVYRKSSEDGMQAVVIYEVGEPDWPFGDAHYKVYGPADFYVDVSDDGGDGWFTVEWKDDSVIIIFGGSEQEDSIYKLPFE